MNETDIKRLVGAVKAGDLSRRSFIETLVGAGLTAPMASVLLMHAGVASAQAAVPAYKPTKRGGGGALKLLIWQAPTLLNPHFANGTKDVEACNIFYETLAYWDQDANLVPVLAAEIPSRENGGLAADGKSVTWKLKKGVTWHDGTPFTADDVVFNWQFSSDPATATFTSGNYLNLKFEKVDTHTVRVVFARPTPFWPGIYTTTQLIPKHLFAPFQGAKSREAPNNLKPVGTGPYKFVDFKPGDMARGALYANYHRPNRPYFDTIELKGGGDAVSAARALMQTGECDYCWNPLVEDEVLLRMEAAGKGRVDFSSGGTVEHLMLNATDPNKEVDGERASIKTKHPVLSDPAVRKALGLLMDRKGMQEYILGRSGVGTANLVNNPPRFNSPNMKAEFNVEKANALLDAAGYKRGADGVREKGGHKLRFLFQTSINAPRQKMQTIIKQACQKAGIDVELKGIVPAVFFSSDVGNPETAGKFWADMQMFARTQGSPDPDVHLKACTSWEIATKANKWQGRNYTRWHSDEFDKTYRAAEGELDPAKRAALMIKMNDIVCSEGFIVPLMFRKKVTGLARKLVAPMTGWDNDMSTLSDWYREA